MSEQPITIDDCLMRRIQSVQSSLDAWVMRKFQFPEKAPAVAMKNWQILMELISEAKLRAVTQFFSFFIIFLLEQTYNFMAAVKLHLGEDEEALELMKTAELLNPKYTIVLF